MRVHSLKDVVAELEKALAAEDLPAAEAMLWPALDQKPEIAVLWHCAGAVFQLSGRHAMAEAAWERAQQLEANPSLWNNRGIAFKCMNRSADARRCYERGLECLPDDPKLLANLCGSYVNEGEPWPGIEAGEKALAAGCGAEGQFNLALLHLEAGNFGRGFDLYAEGKHQHREERDYAQPGETEPPKLTPELHNHLRGTGKTLIVWGEQGLGDEIMFATILNDVVDDYDVVFDCHPRLEWMHQHATWAKRARIVPTRKVRGGPADRPIGVAADAKVAAGDLGRLYRRTRESFAHVPVTYRADEAETREMRAHLQTLAHGRRIVGIATRGGTMSTNVNYRTLPPIILEKIFSMPNTFFVGLDYDDMSELNQWVDTTFPDRRYMWSASVNFAWDYHHTAALIAATDAVITVPQSVMHLACGIGHETHILCPSRPDWRLGVAGDFVWYPGEHVHLHRQVGDDWVTVTNQLVAALEQRESVAA